MDSISDTVWDVVICGTGLQQSLLALSLSRSDKKVLHIDPNEYYGGPEAALGLQEAGEWATSLSADEARPSIFSQAEITRPAAAPEGGQSTGLSFPRAYSLALAPQIIHSRSKLIELLVSSHAHKQVNFVAVGSFFIFRPAEATTTSSSLSYDNGANQQPATLTRIPSTREDVFSTSAIPAKAKRALMKFLKLVAEFDDPESSSRELWTSDADRPLADFLRAEFKLDDESRAYIMTLTLSLDGRVTTAEGLATIHRHMASMGMFGPGFAAVYPKWGGMSEINQVACRAGAVGGGVYMLGTGIKEKTESAKAVELELTNDVKVKTKLLVSADETPAEDGQKVSRLVAVVGSPLDSLFEPPVEGAMTPAVTVVAFPPGSVVTAAGNAAEYPVYAFVHSSETGECPAGQSVLYLATLSTSHARELLETAARSLLATTGEATIPPILYRMHYEQSRGSSELRSRGLNLTLPSPSFSLAFDDATLAPVREAWKKVMGSELTETEEAEYMVFTDREGADEDNDLYD